jgi:ATP-dependent Clp protease adaptor protein ClpS
MPEERTGSGTQTVVKRKTKISSPRLYKVILLNDDYTSMDFVVQVLETVFLKSPAEAVQIMLNIHHKGSGICGLYPKQIAETKVDLVHTKARQEGFPLRCIMEMDR